MRLLPGTLASAELSDDGCYRYKLTRHWDARRESVAFIMLNPSTADALTDDMTLRKCQGFAKRWGAGSLVVVNLFALRATDPAELAHADDPVGPRNDDWLIDTLRARHSAHIAAWGHKGGFLERDRIVTGMAQELGKQLLRIGPPTPQRSMPRHPSRLAYELELQAHG